MTELALFKFCHASGVNCRWDDDDDELIIWIPFDLLKEFTDLVGYTYLSDGGIEVRLQEDCVALKLNDICEDFEIDIKNIYDRR